MNTPKLSIILPTNKLDDHLDEAVTSCLSQTFPHFELLLILNGNAAAQTELAQAKYTDPRIIVFQSRIGHINHSLNIGLDAARAPLIARMDADDICYPERLELQYRLMERHPEITVCSGNYHQIDTTGKIVRLVRLPGSDSAIRALMLVKNPICHPAVMMRTELIRSNGGYLGYIKGEDYDTWVRLAGVPNVRFHNIEQPLIKYRILNRNAAWVRNRSKRAAMVASQFCLFWETLGMRWLFASFNSAIWLVFRDFSEFLRVRSIWLRSGLWKLKSRKINH